MTTDILVTLFEAVEKSFTEYLREEEQEETERQRRIAVMETFCLEIERRRAINEAYVKNFFDRRVYIRKVTEKVIDKAIETGNVEIAKGAMKLIKCEYGRDLFGNLLPMEE